MIGYATEHFSWPELIGTQVRGVDNTPDAASCDNLVRLCETIMEPMREHFGPLHVNSGFRSPEVNARVGGSPTSAHPDGRAIDFIPLRRGVTLVQIMDWVIGNDALPLDQAILEYGRWVHVAIAPDGRAPRRQALAIDEPGWYRRYGETA